MRLFISLFVLFFLSACSEDNNPIPTPASAFTHINGIVSGEFIATKSPYKVTQDIFVDSNSTLKINAGVAIHFEENTKLIVKGELLIEGSESSIVLFRSFNNKKKWGGIKILSADKPAKFDFANIQDIRQDVDTFSLSASISIMNSEVEFRHTLIYQNSAIHGGAVGVYNSKLTFINNIVRDNNADVWGGAIMSELSDIVIINNTFYNNYSNNAVAGVLVFNPIKTELQNNIFYKNLSRAGNPNFYYSSDDSTTMIEQYNYMAFGSMDPKFISETNLTLYQLSPCINSGNPNSSFNDHDGSRNDQGAYGGPLGDW